MGRACDAQRAVAFVDLTPYPSWAVRAVAEAYRESSLQRESEVR